MLSDVCVSRNEVQELNSFLYTVKMVKWLTLKDDRAVLVEDGRGSTLGHLQTLTDVGQPARGL